MPMIISRVTALILALCCLAAPAAGQGFAGLGTEADGFAEVTPGKPIRFPEDYGPHPNYRIEWWYLTATLEAEDGSRLGIQWTLFRQAVKPGQAPEGWSAHEFWMGHAGLTTADRHFSAELLARGGTGQAGAKAAPFEAWIDDWHFTERTDDSGPRTAFDLAAAADDFGFALSLSAQGPEVLQGDKGYSRKSDLGQASYYFSHPFLAATGSVTIDGKTYRVAGNAWLDREWSSQPLAPTQAGWDWFSLRLKGGERLMLFALRDTDGGQFRSGTWIAADGTAEPLAGNMLRMTPLGTARVAGRRVPVRWRIEIPDRGLALTIEPLNTQSWMKTSIAYWEGPVTARGSHAAEGYLEMTGY